MSDIPVRVELDKEDYLLLCDALLSHRQNLVWAFDNIALTTEGIVEIIASMKRCHPLRAKLKDQAKLCNDLPDGET